MGVLPITRNSSPNYNPCSLCPYHTHIITTGIDPDIFATSVVSSFLAVAIWSTYTLVVVHRILQKGGNDKSVGLRREENKASATNLQGSYFTSYFSLELILPILRLSELYTNWRLLFLPHSVIFRKALEPCSVSKLQTCRQSNDFSQQ